MSSHNSTAYCQSTSLLHTPSRNPALLREPSRCPGMSIFAHFHTENHSLYLDNACAFAGHLLTVEMLPQPTRDGRFIVRPLMIKLAFALGLSLAAAAFPRTLLPHPARQHATKA